jgi:ubiquinone/menaquinone biosynthesis C-methylase UbiE
MKPNSIAIYRFFERFARDENSSDVSIQRAYYRSTAERYDEMHVSGKGEHEFALAFMISMIKFHNIKSLLDIGSGTGRVLVQLKKEIPDLKIVGIEPSVNLREIGYRKGLTDVDLIDGDAQHLPFDDGAFDLVCEFGALHHIPNPKLAVSEMLRVCRRAIFVSDSNNFGHGKFMTRWVKQAINSFKLWKIFDFAKTKGKGYLLSEGDGLSYSYSVFNDYRQIRFSCKSVHILNTVDAGINLYRSSAHIALFGIKK